MVRTGEPARPHLFRVAFNGPFDRGSKFAKSLDEFRHPRGEPEHILKDEDLTVTRRAGADANRRGRRSAR